MAVFYPSDFKKYLVTGKLVNGKRFRLETSSYFHANGINLFNGRVYGIHALTGKRVLLKAVFN